MNRTILFIGLVMILLASFVSAQIVFEDPRTTLYHSFDNDEYSAPTYSDLTANNFDVTNVGGTTGGAGIYQESVSFDGLNDYGTINDAITELETHNEGTVCGWIKSTVSSWGLTFSNYGTGSYLSIILAEDYLQFEGNSGCLPANQRLLGDTDITDGTWHHWCASSDGNTISLITDGVNNTIIESLGTNAGYWFNDLTCSPDRLALASLQRTSSIYSDMELDELVIFDEALSLLEMQQLYALGSPTALEQYPFGIPPIPKFELTAEDSLTSIAFTHFNATFQNTTSTVSINTSNGTIFYPKDIVYNITVFKEGYIDTTFINYNTSTNLLATLHSTINILNFTNGDTGNPIENAIISVDYPTKPTLSLTTNATGEITFNTTIDGFDDVGDYIITITAIQGFITPIAFTRTINSTNAPLRENINITSANIIVNIFDRETLTVFTNQVDVILIDYLNDTTSTGQLIIQNVSIIAGELTLQAISTNYITEQTTVTYTGQANATVNFYLLNATGTNTEFLFTSTIDEFFRIQEGAAVSLFQYDPITASFSKVSEKLSNVNGESAFSIELNVKTYYLTATKTIGGVLFSARTSPEIIQTADEVRNLVLRISDDFEVMTTDYLIIEITETFLNNISTIFVEYTTIDNFVAEVCVGYYNMSNNASLIGEQCVNSSASYTAVPTLIERSHNYEGRVYQKFQGQVFPLMSYPYPSITSFDSILDFNQYSEPVFVWAWFIILILSLVTKNVFLYIVSGLVLSWWQFFNAPSVAMGSASVVKSLILLFMSNAARKKEDQN